MSMQLKHAFVLHRRTFQNSSLLVELFSESDGRFPAVMRGVAKGKSVGLIQLFQPLLISWAGKGEVKSLGAVEPDDYQLNPLRGKALYCGLYLNELLMRLMPRYEAHQQLFVSYIRTLSLLDEAQLLDWTLRLFELRLLQELGYELMLAETCDGKAVAVDKYYSYHHTSGFIETVANAADAVSGATLVALQNKRCDDILQRRQAKYLLRSIIDYHLDYKPIKSRELFQ